jgi:hypothetical protein
MDTETAGPSGHFTSFTWACQADNMGGDPDMVNYILLYKIRKAVKKLLKDKIEDDELATTPRSCLGCLADEISWEIYYLVKEKGDDKPD